MAIKEKKAIIFDFGNVIAFFDYDKVVDNFIALGDGNFAPSETKEKLFAKDLLKDFEVGNLSSSSFISEVKQRLGLENVSDEEIAEAWSNLFTPNQEVIKVIEQIPEEITLVLGSTTNPLHFEYYRREFADTLGKFKALVTSFHVGTVKPDPVFYERCLKEANCEPTDCVYVDDIPEYIDAASKMDIEGIAYSPETDIAKSLQEKGVLF